jgi:hypothetical protein
MDAGMPMPALVFWMPMPSYEFLLKIFDFFSQLQGRKIKFYEFSSKYFKRKMFARE